MFCRAGFAAGACEVDGVPFVSELVPQDGGFLVTASYACGTKLASGGHGAVHYL